MNLHLKTAYSAGAKQAQEDFTQAPLAKLLPDSDAMYLKELAAPPPAPLSDDEHARLKQLETILTLGRAAKNPLVKMTTRWAPKIIKALRQKDTPHEPVPATSV